MSTKYKQSEELRIYYANIVHVSTLFIRRCSYILEKLLYKSTKIFDNAACLYRLPRSLRSLSWIIGSSKFYHSLFFAFAKNHSYRTSTQDVLGAFQAHGALAKIRVLDFRTDLISNLFKKTVFAKIRNI